MLALILIDWIRIGRNTVKGSVVGAALFLIIYFCERRYGKPDERYLSRSFFHDLIYWLYVRSDLPRLIFTVWLFSLISQPLQLLDLHLLDSWPLPVRWVTFFLAAEFIAYWIHRCQHSVRFLWAFHSVHHSAESLTFATESRQHPLDSLVINTLPVIPLMVLGPAPQNWLPVVVLIEFLIGLEHSELPWRFGPLYKVVVSPTFHSFHHSTQPQHQNRNFSRLLSVFDFLFGTAVDEPERPKAYGVPGVRMPTLASQMVHPFVLINRWYFGKEAPTGAENKTVTELTTTR